MAGVGGMLGAALYEEFKHKHTLSCSDKDVNEEWLHYLDFTNLSNYQNIVKDFKPDILFHIGALTDLEYCEDHEDEAYMTNLIGTENAVHIANRMNIPVVYISTAGIFDGEKSSYDDWDIPDPINVYGRTKYLGEKYVIDNADRYYIFRSGWMMGGGDKDKKFVKKILDIIDSGADKIYAVTDKMGSPTYTVDLARCIHVVITLQLFGLYNASGSGSVSREDVAKGIVNILKLPIKVIPATSSFFPEYSTPRPKSEVLINRRLDLRGINTMRPPFAALKHYLNDYRQLQH
jgi:dTDP-4-dehydrorhamnose reductase